MSTKTPASLASMAALLALSASAFAADAPAGGATISAGDTVHCYGIHACKGNSDCKTAEHACKGQNACKGHGFKAVKAKACLDKGGKIGDIQAK